MSAPVNIIVCVKQVLDPEMPASAFKVDPETKRVVESQGTPPVLNGFDENAVEAALRIKDAVGAHVTALSMGRSFVMDVVKKPLSMGADELVLLQDDSFHDLDSYATATVLSEAIRKIGDYDLILAGRQASDWDNAQVPLGIAEMLDLPCLTVAQKVDVADGTVSVQQVVPDGYRELEADLPALVTVTNELGEPRYATLRGIMAGRTQDPHGLERRRSWDRPVESGPKGHDHRSLRPRDRPLRRDNRGRGRRRRRPQTGPEAPRRQTHLNRNVTTQYFLLSISNDLNSHTW